MKTFSSVDEILHFAIKSAKETADFFIRLSKQARNSKVKRVFERYAREEFAHMVHLMKVREIGPMELTKEQMDDLRISDYTLDLRETKDLVYTEALVMAMRKVRVAFKLYLDLAAKTPNDEIQTVLKNLANTEARHKRGFEIEYNEALLLC